MLNPASPLPLYHQLAELLSSRIARGELQPGARLPSEPELSRTHRIGRPTVRQATELLVQRGLIERRRGSGTYVRSAARRVDLFSLAGTLESFQAGGIQLSSRIFKRLARRRVEADAENPFSERTAFTFSRVSSVEGTPVLLEQLYLDPEVFPDLPSVPLSGVSLSQLVQERYHLKPTHAEQSFRVALPGRDVRSALELGARDALLLVKRTLFFPRAPRAIYCELYCQTRELAFSQIIGAELSHG